MVIFNHQRYYSPIKVVKSRVNYKGNLILNLICDHNGCRFLMTIIVRPLDGKP